MAPTEAPLTHPCLHPASTSHSPGSSFPPFQMPPSPFLSPSYPIPSPQLTLPPMEKGLPVDGLAKSISSHKGSVSPGDTWNPDRMEFLPIFFTAEKTHANTRAYLLRYFYPKVCLKKKEEEIKLVSLPTPRLPHAHSLPFSFLAEAREKNRAGPSPTENHCLPDNVRLVQRVRKEAQLRKHTQNFPVKGLPEGRRTGSLVSGHGFPEALGRGGPASLAPSSQWRRHLTVLASGGIFLGHDRSHWT